MKKSLITSFIIIVTTYGYSQEWPLTQSTWPGPFSHNINRLETQWGYIDVGPQNSGWAHINTNMSKFYFNKPIVSGTGSFGAYSNNDLKFKVGETSSFGSTAMTIKSLNSNVGIGTTNPLSRLHLDGGYMTIDGNTTTWNTWNVRLATPVNSAWVQKDPANNGEYLSYGMTSTGWFWGTSPLTLGSTGTDIKYALQLSTDGLLTAREIQVTLSGWADYVFQEDYELMTLQEVEDYIQLNGHLPDVPSEKEVLESGVNVGEMDAILLRKIEELTLHVIEQDKKIALLESQIK